MAALVTVEANAILDETSGYGSGTVATATGTSAITAIAVAAMPVASVGSADVLLLTNGTVWQIFVASASWAANATSISVTSETPLVSFPIGATVYDLTASYKVPYGPIKVALNSAVGSASAAGTEISGGSYARQPLVVSAASAESITTSAALTYTSMPAVTVTSIDEFDSAGTPIRRWWGSLTTSKTTNSGDTFSIASGSYTKTLS